MKYKPYLIKVLTLVFIVLFIPSYYVSAASTLLKKGMQSEAVLLLQEKLKVLGQFKAVPTGYFGSITESSVKAFQKSNNLAPDGIVGKHTLTALDKAVNSRQTYIILDPGHGGEDLGTVSGKLYEKNINLDIAHRVKDYLNEQNFSVLMTRDRDISLASRSEIRGTLELKDLEARTRIVNKSNANLFVSIHVDSLPSEPDKNGSVVYYNPSVQGSEALASHLQKELNKITIDGKKRDSNKSSSANFYILRNSDIPGVLVESGFITNKAEKTSFQQAAFRDDLAKAIFNGITEYVK